jgi:hypothetical protein
MTHTPPRTDLYLLSLWFGVLAGPIVWSLHFLAGYGLSEVACRLRLLESPVMGLTALSLIILFLTFGALIITLYAGFIAYRNWHSANREGLPSSNAAEPRRLDRDSGQFMALSGLILSALFSFLILATGLPVLVLRPCG